MARSTHDDGAFASTSPVGLVPLSSAEDQQASYTWKNVVISVWFGRLTLDSLAVHDEQLNAFCAAHPNGVSSVSMVLPGKFALPSAEVREELGRFVLKYAERVVAAALILPGEGFWASAVRGAVTAVTLVGRRDVKPQIFQTSRQAADWLPPVHLQRTGITIDADELAAILEKSELAHTKAL